MVFLIIRGAGAPVNTGKGCKWKNDADRKCPRRLGTPGETRTHYIPLRSMAFPFCVLLYFLYSFFSFHIMLYGGYT